jgi:hypothetical protein
MISLLSLVRYFNSAFTFSIGGGIGEAALIGAAFGGAKALATGQDPLEAALLGGVTGGAMSGVTGALFGGAGSAAAGTTGEVAKDATGQVLASSVPGTTGTSAFTDAVNAGNPTAASDFVANSVGTQTANAGLTGLNSTMQPVVNAGGISTAQGVGSKAIEQAAAANAGQAGLTSSVAQPSVLGQLTDKSNLGIFDRPGVDLRNYTSPDTMAGKGLDWWAKQGEGGRAMYAGLGGAAYGMMNPEAPKGLPVLTPEKSKLAGYERDQFTPYEPATPNPYYHAQYAAEGGVMRSYADGGIAALANGGVGLGQNQNYPQAMQDHTQYATPTQMPASAQVVDSDYDAPTNTYTGEPIKGMAAGGTTTPAGGAVMYDPKTQSYYTQSRGNMFGGLSAPNNGMNGGMLGGDNVLWSSMMADNPIYQGMANDPNSLFWNGRTYLNGNPFGATSTPGVSSNFQANQVAPQVYQQQQQPLTQVAQAATNPAVQQAVLGANQGSQGYSLADSLPLLQATNPGIAAQVAPSAQPEKKAQGGIAGFSLGGYAAGGNPRLLKGPGDGMSDNIPATIGGKQPARLADGEFVVPADVVSHLGNGSTDAGAKHLYNMMDKVRKARTGKVSQGKQINPNKFMPA